MKLELEVVQSREIGIMIAIVTVNEMLYAIDHVSGVAEETEIGGKTITGMEETREGTGTMIEMGAWIWQGIGAERGAGPALLLGVVTRGHQEAHIREKYL